jgi:hypothetical protein
MDRTSWLFTTGAGAAAGSPRRFFELVASLGRVNDSSAFLSHLPSGDRDRRARSIEDVPSIQGDVHRIDGLVQAADALGPTF